MKIALLSDIHSNVFALEAVIANAKTHSVDTMVNLGDILYGPIAPKATYDLLMKQSFVTVCGNQDRQIYEATKEDASSNSTLQYILNDLGEEPLEWMKSLPFDVQLNNDVYLCHGTPTDDLVYLLENVENGYARLGTDGEITARLKGQGSNVIACGHTHMPRTVTLATGQIIVNPGSVGLQAYTDNEPVMHSMENYTPHASYAIIEKTKTGYVTQHIRVPYNVFDAVTECKKRGRMDWVHFLTTGRKL